MGNGYQQESFQKTTPKPRKNPDQTDVNSREKVHSPSFDKQTNNQTHF